MDSTDIPGVLSIVMHTRDNNVLREKGLTIKKIGGKHYLYTQKKKFNGKLKCVCLGPASPAQINYDKDRAEITKWLRKNETQFLKGLKYIEDLWEGKFK